MYKKFEPGQVLYSLTETHPKVEFFLNSGSVGSVYYNRDKKPTGSLLSSGEIGFNALNVGSQAAPIVAAVPGNYYLWLNARDLNGNGDGNAGYTDGDRISLWQPQSGTTAPTASFIQGAASTERPYYAEAELNGQPAVSFLEQHKVFSDDLTLWKRFQTGSWSMFVVMKQYGQDPETAQWVVTNEEGSLVGRRGFGFGLRRLTTDLGGAGTDRTVWSYVLNSQDYEHISLYSPSGSYEYGEVMLLRIKMDFADNNQMYKDGSLVATTGSEGTPYTLNPSQYTLTVGGRARTNTSYFSGAVGDIILFDYLTTDEQDSQIEAYLQQIYGDFTTI